MNAVAELTKLEGARDEPIKRVKPNSLQLAEFAYARYSVELPVGWSLDDVLDPDVWAHVAHKLDRNKSTNEPARTGAIIEIRTEDHAFYAELYVRAVREKALDVQLVSYHVLGPKVIASNDRFETRWNVGRRGFDIVRLSDKAVVAQGFPKKEDATAWIEQTAG